jgi:hypothetical protein
MSILVIFESQDHTQLLRDLTEDVTRLAKALRPASSISFLRRPRFYDLDCKSRNTRLPLADRKNMVHTGFEP